MKTLGMIGGTGPESTVDYYKTLTGEYKARFPGAGIPPILINSINYRPLMDYLEPRDWQGMAEMLAAEFDKLKRAGADFGLISANTPHVCFRRLAPISPLPLLSIVEAARDESLRLGAKQLLLLGTRLTMEDGFYQDVFAPAGLSITVPNEEDREYVGRKYFEELFEGVLLEETRQEMLAIIARQPDIDAVLLGGTELPMLLRGAASPVPLLDTARVHCLAALDEMIT